MPVLIASHKTDVDIVRAVALRLREAGGEVRCYIDEDDHELRDMGCKVAVGLLDDSYNLSGALTNVHTFMPLMPDSMTWHDPSTVEQVGAAWASAAAATEIEQTILAVSQVGDAFDRVKDVFQRACDPLAVIRTRMVVGTSRPMRPGTGAVVPAVYVDKLAEVLAAADEVEGLTGEWALDGWPIEVDHLPDTEFQLDFVPDNTAAQKFLPGTVTQTPPRE